MMTAPRSPGFFALGRYFASRSRKQTTDRVIPAEDATERNALEANVLGCLTFVFWVLAVDATLSGLPLLLRLPLAVLIAFVLIQLFTAAIALTLEKTLVASGKWTAKAARAFHTRVHIALLLVASIGIGVMGFGPFALNTVAWIWIGLGVVNAVAAALESRS